MLNLSNLSISKKLALLSGVSLAVLLSVGIIALVVISKLSDDIDDLSSVQMTAMHSAMQADMMHDGLRAVVFRSIIAAQTKDEPGKQESTDELEEFTESFNNSLKELDQLPLDAATKKSIADVYPALREYIAESEEITKTALSNQPEKAINRIPKFQERFKTLEGKMETLGNLIEQNAQKSTEKSVREVGYAKATLIIASLLGFIFALVLSVLIARSIVGRLKTLAEIVGRLSAKNIEEKIDCSAEDEIGIVTRAFRDAYQYLERIAQAADGLSHGKFDVELAARSEEDTLSSNFMTVTKTLKSLIAETTALTKGAQAGDLSYRGNAKQFEGGYRELIENINITLNSIAEPINESAQVLEKIADKDLTVQMKGEYKGDFAKIKTSVNIAAENLRQGFEQVASSADQVASAAEQISQGSQSFAHGASEQASTLEEVSSNLHEISAMTKQNAANSIEARALSAGALKTAEVGLRNMSQLNEAVERIKTSSDSTAKIVKTIEEIAFQTNLLALNAAVEAARAGDAGKGFAVVAEEVRNLAMRSAEAARNSATMISEAVSNTSEGVALNAQVSKNLEEINGQIQKVSSVVEEIAAATEQQSEGIDQINSAVGQISNVTQEIAANSEESASSAEELSGQSQEMMSLISRYKLGEIKKSAVQISFKHTAKKHNPELMFSSADFSGKGKSKNSSAAKSDRENFISFDDLGETLLSDF